MERVASAGLLGVALAVVAVRLRTAAQDRGERTQCALTRCDAPARAGIHSLDLVAKRLPCRVVSNGERIQLAILGGLGQQSQRGAGARDDVVRTQCRALRAELLPGQV